MKKILLGLLLVNSIVFGKVTEQGNYTKVGSSSYSRAYKVDRKGDLVEYFRKNLKGIVSDQPNGNFLHEFKTSDGTYYIVVSINNFGMSIKGKNLNEVSLITAKILEELISFL